MLKLFYAPSACSLASHIALEETGVEYESQLIDFKTDEQHSAEYLAINPKGRVPALATDRGVLTESPVILGFIAESFPDADFANVETHLLLERCNRSTFGWLRTSMSPLPMSSGRRAMPKATNAQRR